MTTFGGRGLDGSRLSGRSRRLAQIGVRISRGSRERRMRRLRNGQLYSAGLTRVGIEAPVRRPLGPPSSGVSKDGSSGT